MCKVAVSIIFEQNLIKKKARSKEMSDLFTYPKKKRDVGLPYNPFQDTEVKVVGFMPTQQQQSQEFGANHLKRDPNFITIDNIPEMSEHVVNTERVTIFDKGMSHKEGGKNNFKSS